MTPAPSRPRCDDLGPGPDPAHVVSALADEPGLACLWGSWRSSALDAGAHVLIMSRPRATSREVSALDAQPATTTPQSQAPLIGGGWIGWLGYDAPNHLAFYDHLLRYSFDTGRWAFEALWTRRRASALRSRRELLSAVLTTLATGPSDPSPRPRPSVQDLVGEFDGVDRSRHLAAVEQAIGLIRAGEIYQVNVCTRIGAQFTGTTADAARMFATAASSLRPRFGAFIDGGERVVVSLSPELFLGQVRDRVVSSPIKGTWKRDPNDPNDDGADRLRHSTKDIAENVMIVDLVRNDLGRVCRTGTVQVEQLLTIAPHPGVWHLVSTVSGRLRPSVTTEELIGATFPPGSVTGVPKLRAEPAITAIEDGPRGVYTGAIGMAGPLSGPLFSVAIRTFEVADGRIELGVGGGITADSVPELEWRECVQKAAPLVQAIGARPVRAFAEVAGDPSTAQLAGGLIETILAIDGIPLRLADHLGRLDRSARELYGFAIPPTLAGEVRAAAAASIGRLAIRVLALPSATVTVTAAAASRRPAGTDVELALRRGVWRHKWADRRWAQASSGEQLFISPDGSILETTRGNVFIIEADGALVTPPLRDDLLPGVTRRAVLDLAADRGWPARIESFAVSALHQAGAAFWTSSLSGVVAITAVDGQRLASSPDTARRLGAIAAGIGFEVPPSSIVS